MKKIEKHCDFSFKHYKQILKLAKKEGYEFSFFSEAPNKKNKKIYLRHDVDFSVEGALRLAKLESKNGVASTFFIRLDASFYNLFDQTYCRMIEEIIDLGHQIGLHFDEKSVNRKKLTKNNIEQKVMDQLQILKRCFDIKNIVSFHCPSKFVLNKKFDAKKFINTYDPQFFAKIKYLSESRSQWREGCVCNFLESSVAPKNFQVLIHAESWGTKGKDANSRLVNSLKEKIDYLDKMFAVESEAYRRGSFYKLLNKNEIF